uniref:Uncharacterized protein n=1 Tax=Nelumbo nucifera TaxID=4432 RepID=A0A822ZT47_NELNU|nr:TPA_asm: hypothetical protein HUJ06_016426 [Nelumbo nucifera]
MMERVITTCNKMSYEEDDVEKTKLVKILLEIEYEKDDVDNIEEGWREPLQLARRCKAKCEENEGFRSNTCDKSHVFVF